MSERELWRTTFNPLPDITAYELALDLKYVNRSQVIASDEFQFLGGALRHRNDDDTGERMDVIAARQAIAKDRT